ncbi:MAG: hypothetical protein ABR552_01205 [Actinomycetota bacterium]
MRRGFLACTFLLLACSAAQPTAPPVVGRYLNALVAGNPRAAYELTQLDQLADSPGSAVAFQNFAAYFRANPIRSYSIAKVHRINISDAPGQASYEVGVRINGERTEVFDVDPGVVASVVVEPFVLEMHGPSGIRSFTLDHHGRAAAPNGVVSLDRAARFTFAARRLPRDRVQNVAADRGERSCARGGCRAQRLSRFHRLIALSSMIEAPEDLAPAQQRAQLPRGVRMAIIAFPVVAVLLIYLWPTPTLRATGVHGGSADVAVGEIVHFSVGPLTSTGSIQLVGAAFVRAPTTVEIVSIKALNPNENHGWEGGISRGPSDPAVLHDVGAVHVGSGARWFLWVTARALQPGSFDVGDVRVAYRARNSDRTLVIPVSMVLNAHAAPSSIPTKPAAGA